MLKYVQLFGDYFLLGMLLGLVFACIFGLIYNDFTYFNNGLYIVRAYFAGYGVGVFFRRAKDMLTSSASWRTMVGTCKSM